jgi:hypothetical protein
VAGALIPLRAEDFVLAFSGMVVAYSCGNYEACSSLHLSYPRACSAGFRRPSTALSGETNAALQRPSDHYRERLALNITEQRAKITGVNLRGNFWCQRCLVGERSVISIIVAREFGHPNSAGLSLGLVVQDQIP